MIDLASDFGYRDGQGDRIAVADVLQKLKEDLEERRAALAVAKRAVEHLEIAIGAIERREAEAKKCVERQRPSSKRGYLSRAVIDAIRDGIWAASAIVSHLEQQGIKTTQPSVSNAINRLQAKKQIRFDHKLRRWTLATDSSLVDEGGAGKTSGRDVPSGAVNGGVSPAIAANSGAV